jgi:hypothetical protein
MAMAWRASAARQVPTASQKLPTNARRAQSEVATRGLREIRNAARGFDSILFTGGFYHSRQPRSRQVAKMLVGIDLFARRCIEGGQLTKPAGPVTYPPHLAKRQPPNG